MKRRLLAGCLSAACLLMAISGAAAVSGYRINTTASMPEGIWRARPIALASLRRGMVVSVCLPQGKITTMAFRRGYIGTGSCPERIEPIIKEVVGVAGDIIRVSRDSVAVDGKAVLNSRRLPWDTTHRDLPQITDGPYVLRPGSVWVMGTTSPLSFDSRYFGALPISAITGEAVPVWVRQ